MNSLKNLPNQIFLLPSLVIAIALILQGGSSLNLFCFPKSLKFLPRFELACDPTLYPFTEYPMFNGTHKLGSTRTDYLLFGVLEDSTVVPIQWSDFGFSYATQMSFYNQVIRDGLNSGKQQKINEIIQHYETINQQKLQAIQMKKHSITLTKDGYTVQPLETRYFYVSR